MKSLIITIFLLCSNLFSAIWIEEGIGTITDYNKVSLPDGSIYSILKGVGVGKITILGGTGVFSKLIGIECLYGIKHMKKNVFTTTKCEIPDNIFNELKNDN